MPTSTYDWPYQRAAMRCRGQARSQFRRSMVQRPSPSLRATALEASLYYTCTERVVLTNGPEVKQRRAGATLRCTAEVPGQRRKTPRHCRRARAPSRRQPQKRCSMAAMLFRERRHKTCQRSAPGTFITERRTRAYTGTPRTPRTPRTARTPRTPPAAPHAVGFRSAAPN